MKRLHNELFNNDLTLRLKELGSFYTPSKPATNDHLQYTTDRFTSTIQRLKCTYLVSFEKWLRSSPHWHVLLFFWRSSPYELKNEVSVIVIWPADML